MNMDNSTNFNICEFIDGSLNVGNYYGIGKIQKSPNEGAIVMLKLKLFIKFSPFGIRC